MDNGQLLGTASVCRSFNGYYFNLLQVLLVLQCSTAFHTVSVVVSDKSQRAPPLPACATSLLCMLSSSTLLFLRASSLLFMHSCCFCCPAYTMHSFFVYLFQLFPACFAAVDVTALWLCTELLCSHHLYCFVAPNCFVAALPSAL